MTRKGDFAAHKITMLHRGDRNPRTTERGVNLRERCEFRDLSFGQADSREKSWPRRGKEKKRHRMNLDILSDLVERADTRLEAKQ